MLEEENRLKALMIIWGATTLLSVLSFIFLGGWSVIVVPVLAVSAWMSTDRLFEQTKYDAKVQQGTSSDKSKSHSETRLLLTLLDEGDLLELRERVKSRLLDDAYEAVDGELSALDVLLSEQNQDNEYR